MGLFTRGNKSNSGVQLNWGWPLEADPGFAVIDLETTGLSPRQSRVVEIAIIRTDANGKALGYWTSLINPQGEMGASEIHGIKSEHVQGKPSFDDLSQHLITMLKGQVLVAHNASFDLSFLEVEFARSGWQMPNLVSVCTMIESGHFIPGLHKRSLQACVEALGVAQAVKHRATEDAALATALLHFYLNAPTNPTRADALRKLTTPAAMLPWPTEKTFPKIDGNRRSNLKFSTRPAKRASSDIAKRVSELLPEDVLPEEPSREAITYADVLMTAIKDGEIDQQEIDELRELAATLRLSAEACEEIHRLLVVALAREAWRDGNLTQAEKSDIDLLSLALDIPKSDSKAIVADIEAERHARIVARSVELPHGWTLGEPLRIGDRVAITGCYENGRFDLEDRARKLGVRITGSISGLTNLLVSDGTINGVKDNQAKQLGIRVVGPEDFRTLMDYIQPASVSTMSERPKRERPATDGILEHLLCVSCSEKFTRTVTKGRKPHRCPNCRSD